MKTVYLKVDEEYVDGAGKIAGAKGSSGSTDILVEFSPDWEALSKYATTRDAKGLHPETTVLGLDRREPIGEEGEERYAYRFSLTSNAMCEEGHMSITFTGYEIDSGNETETVINTALAKLRVLPSDYAEMDDGSVTPTIAQQLQAEIDSIEAEYSELPEKVAEAEAYANASHSSATESKSWAIGGTNSRTGEDTDNSKYYSEQSDNSSISSFESSVTSGTRATESKSYAVGGTQTREGEDTDNAKYYMEQARAAAEHFEPVDSLDSYSTTQPLSANQGRVLDGKITDINSAKGAANGFASLDNTGKLPYSQLPESAMEYKGTWDALTNTPTLTQGVGTNGDFYVVSVAGTWDNTDFSVGDRLLFDENQGTTGLWVRLTAGEVQSVNGMTGVVSLGADDVPFDNTGTTIVATNTEDAIKELSVGAGTQVIPKTWAEYQADKQALDASGNIIKITDSGIYTRAAGVSFTPPTGMLAGNVQAAIEENRASIDDINSKLTYTVLASGTPNTTYATQLTALKSTYESLSDEDKRRCKLEEVFPDGVTIIVLQMFGVNNGSFFNISVASNAVYGSTYTISNGAAYTSNNNTVTNKSNASTDHTLRLVKY